MGEKSPCIARLKPDGTRAETRFRLSPKRTSPFKLAGESVQSTAGSRGVRINVSRARAEPDGSRAETSFRLSPKWTSPFKSAGESIQSTAGSRGGRISVGNAGYTTSRGRVRVLATHSIRQFPLHFPSRASPCATTFRTQYNDGYTTFRGSVRVLATHSIRQYPLHFPSRASPCAIRFQTSCTNTYENKLHWCGCKDIKGLYVLNRLVDLWPSPAWSSCFIE